MVVTHAPDISDAFSTTFIRTTARQLVADRFFTAADLDDLIQELTLELLRCLGSFDPECAKWSTFVKTVVSRKAISLCRMQTAERRGGGDLVESLDQTVLDEDGQPAPLVNTLSEAEAGRHQGRAFRGTRQTRDLEADVQSVLAGLPEDLAELCHRLKSQSLVQIAEELGIPRSTLNYRINLLRERFEEAGLRDYLGATSSAS